MSLLPQFRLSFTNTGRTPFLLLVVALKLTPSTFSLISRLLQSKWAVLIERQLDQEVTGFQNLTQLLAFSLAKCQLLIKSPLLLLAIRTLNLPQIHL